MTFSQSTLLTFKLWILLRSRALHVVDVSTATRWEAGSKLTVN